MDKTLKNPKFKEAVIKKTKEFIANPKYSKHKKSAQQFLTKVQNNSKKVNKKENSKPETRAGPRKSGVPDENFVPNKNVKELYKRNPRAGPTKAQKEFVQGKPCVDCGKVTSKQVAYHKEPLVVEHYKKGYNNIDKQRKVDAVQPHCPQCSSQQGGQLGAFGKKMKKWFIKENVKK